MNVSKMNLWKTQIALLNRIEFAFELCKENPLPKMTINESMTKTKEQMKVYLQYEVKAESYRMVVINYLSALIGQRRNDKVSIYHNMPVGKESMIMNFYKNNIEFIQNLANTRDKVYSHFDMVFLESCKKIEYEEIKSTIDFISNVLKG